MWNWFTLRRYYIDSEEHQFVVGKELCRACLRPIVTGDYVTLFPLGPGDSEEERARMAAGITYTARCAIVHWDCAHHYTEEHTDESK